MSKLNINILQDGSATVQRPGQSEVAWDGERVRRAIEQAAVCKESRVSEDPCDCTCCQVDAAVVKHFMAGIDTNWAKTGRVSCGRPN